MVFGSVRELPGGICNYLEVAVRSTEMYRYVSVEHGVPEVYGKFRECSAATGTHKEVSGDVRECSSVIGRFQQCSGVNGEEELCPATIGGVFGTRSECNSTIGGRQQLHEGSLEYDRNTIRRHSTFGGTFGMPSELHRRSEMAILG